jgi:AcrR family transcriptional regulator
LANTDGISGSLKSRYAPFFLLSTLYYFNLDNVKIAETIRSMPMKTRKTDYHHGNLRAALIQCGIELIEEHGIRALTLREIGKRLKVSRTAAYAHFKDKAALLAAIRDAGFIEFVKAIETARKGAAGFAAQMDAMSIAYFHFAKEHPAHFEVMFNTLLEAGGGAAAEGGPVFKILKETIREAQQQGEVRPGDPALLARVVWALVHGVSMLQRDSAEPQFIGFSNEVLRSGLNDASGPSTSSQARRQAAALPRRKTLP